MSFLNGSTFQWLGQRLCYFLLTLLFGLVRPVIIVPLYEASAVVTHIMPCPALLRSSVSFPQSVWRVLGMWPLSFHGHTSDLTVNPLIHSFTHRFSSSLRSFSCDVVGDTVPILTTHKPRSVPTSVLIYPRCLRWTSGWSPSSRDLCRWKSWWWTTTIAPMRRGAAQTRPSRSSAAWTTFTPASPWPSSPDAAAIVLVRFLHQTATAQTETLWCILVFVCFVWLFYASFLFI